MSDIDSKTDSDGYKTVDDFNPPYACDGHRKVTTEIREWANHISGAVGNSEYIKLVRMIDAIDEWIDGHGLSLEDGFGSDAESRSSSTGKSPASDAREVVDDAKNTNEDHIGVMETASHGVKLEEGATTGSEGTVAESLSLPIMPISNILTEEAARRVLSRSCHDSDDPISKSMRAKKAIQDGIGWFAPDVVTAGLSTASSKVIFRMSHLGDRIANVSEIRKSGYASGDIMTLGSSLVQRFAKMLTEISEATSDGLMDDVARALARASAWHEYGYYDTASLLGHDVAYDTSTRIRREFDGAWEWIRAHVFDLENMPSEPGFRRDFWDIDTKSLDSRDGLGGMLQSMNSIAHGEPTMADLRAMPYAELTRLSDMLREFSEYATSWPEVYPDRPQLIQVGDDWEEQQYWDFLGGIRTNNIQGSREQVSETDDDGKEKVYYRAKTNRQMGLAFAAWTQDCHEASSVIGHWGRENAHEETAMTLRDIMEPESRRKIERRRKATWEWLGHYVFCMNC